MSDKNSLFDIFYFLKMKHHMFHMNSCLTFFTIRFLNLKHHLGFIENSRGKSSAPSLYCCHQTNWDF